MSRALVRAPLVAAYFWVVAAIAALFFAPLFSGEELVSLLQSAAEVPLLGLSVYAILRAKSSSEDPLIRWFWSLLAAGFGCLFLGYLVDAIILEWQFRTDLFGDFSIVGFYLLVALALELRLVGRRTSPYRVVRMIATVIFILGLTGYFILLPGIFNRDVYDTWIPSLVLYVVLDAHLAARAGGLWRAASPGPWRGTYGFLLVAFAAWLVLDGLELLSLMGLVVLPDTATLLDFLWFTPYLAVVIGVEYGTRASRAGLVEVATDSRLTRPPTVAIQPLFFAVVLPTLHLFAYNVGLADISLRNPRDMLVLSMLPILAGLALLHHRLLEQENEHLERERERVASTARHAQHIEAVGRLAGGIAHDLNNMLLIIQVSNSLLMESFPPGSPVHRSSREIEQAVGRAAILTHHVSAFGRSKYTDPRPVAMNEVFSRAASMVERLIGDFIKVDVEPGVGVGRVNVDQDQLEQAVLNLAVNARDAMPDGGRMTLESSRVYRDPPVSVPAEDTGTVAWGVITVRDTGHGMDDATKARIFEPFFTTKEEGQGTGLGLSMVRSFVSQSGGFVEVDSAVNVGTVVRLFLPIIGESVHIRGREPVVELTPMPRPGAVEQQTVLVVEDESAVRSSIRDLLSAHGFQVIEAEDGEGALRVLRDGATPALMLTDIILPGMRGPELARYVLEQHPKIRILFMTGHAGSERESLHLSGENVLEKPFTPEFLTSRVQEALESVTS